VGPAGEGAPGEVAQPRGLPLGPEPLAAAAAVGLPPPVDDEVPGPGLAVGAGEARHPVGRLPPVADQLLDEGGLPLRVGEEAALGLHELGEVAEPGRAQGGAHRELLPHPPGHEHGVDDEHRVRRVPVEQLPAAAGLGDEVREEDPLEVQAATEDPQPLPRAPAEVRELPLGGGEVGEHGDPVRGVRDEPGEHPGQQPRERERLAPGELDLPDPGQPAQPRDDPPDQLLVRLTLAVPAGLDAIGAVVVADPADLPLHRGLQVHGRRQRRGTRSRAGEQAGEQTGRHLSPPPGPCRDRRPRWPPACGTI